MGLWIISFCDSDNKIYNRKSNIHNEKYAAFNKELQCLGDNAKALYVYMILKMWVKYVIEGEFNLFDILGY